MVQAFKEQASGFLNFTRFGAHSVDLINFTEKIIDQLQFAVYNQHLAPDKEHDESKKEEIDRPDELDEVFHPMDFPVGDAEGEDLMVCGGIYDKEEVLRETGKEVVATLLIEGPLGSHYGKLSFQESLFLLFNSVSAMVTVSLLSFFHQRVIYWRYE